MVVVFTGPTGVCKDQVKKKVIEDYLAVRGTPAADTERHFLTLSLEDEIKAAGCVAHIRDFLNERKRRVQQEVFDRGFRQVLERVKAAREGTHVLLDAHLVYFRDQDRLNLWRFRDFEALAPDCFVTLIDDAISIWHRIHRKERGERRGSYVTLQEVFEWRRQEFHLTECLARSLGKDSYLVAVKHPAVMLRRLLFEPGKHVRLYTAYPITAPREGAPVLESAPGGPHPWTDGQAEINQHRDRIREGNRVVWDPLTIDDRALRSAFLRDFGEGALKEPPEFRRDTVVRVNYSDRWPAQADQFPPMVNDPDDMFPVTIPAVEAFPVLWEAESEGRPIRSIVDSQIEERDYSYIEKAGTIAAYRPYWHGRESKGVCAELRYAGGMADGLIYHPDEDQREGGSPFGELPPFFTAADPETFYAAVAAREQEKARPGGS